MYFSKSTDLNLLNIHRFCPECKLLLDRKLKFMKNIKTKSIKTIEKKIIPFKVKHPAILKSDKKIEVLVVPKDLNPNKNQKNVAIVWDEHSIFTILSSAYHCVIITEIKSENDLKQLALRKPDLVFSGVKYFNFNDRIIWLNDYLEMHGISYIASGREALEYEHDKSRAKEIMQKANIKTADFFTTKPGEHQDQVSLPIKFPLFIKPVTGGDSRGIDCKSVVHNFKSFKAKVLDIKMKQKSISLVETFLSGKEYSVGILHDTISGTLKAMPVEIMVDKNINGHCILDFDIKKNDEEVVIAVADKEIFNQLCNLAKKSFVALGGKSLGRIDIKMNHLNEPHFIEANLMPGLSKGYFFRSCFLNLNMSYEEMILLIAKNGIASSKNPTISKVSALDVVESISLN